MDKKTLGQVTSLISLFFLNLTILSFFLLAAYVESESLMQGALGREKVYGVLFRGLIPILVFGMPAFYFGFMATKKQ